jgi:hypothetical protein
MKKKSKFRIPKQKLCCECQINEKLDDSVYCQVCKDTPYVVNKQSERQTHGKVKL